MMNLSTIQQPTLSQVAGPPPQHHPGQYLVYNAPPGHQAHHQPPQGQPVYYQVAQPAPVYVQQQPMHPGLIYVVPVQQHHEPQPQLLYTQPSVAPQPPAMMSYLPPQQQSFSSNPMQPAFASSVAPPQLTRMTGSDRLAKLAAELNEKDTHMAQGGTSTADSSPLRLANHVSLLHRNQRPLFQHHAGLRAQQSSSTAGSKKLGLTEGGAEDEPHDPHNDTEEEILSYLSSSSKEQHQHRTATKMASTDQRPSHLKHQVIDVSKGKAQLNALLANSKNPESSFDTEQDQKLSLQAAEEPQNAELHKTSTLTHQMLDTTQVMSQNQIFYDKSKVLIAPKAAHVPSFF